MASSLVTVAGALGSSLENEETVHKATYGYRQRRRNDFKQDKDESAAA